MWPGGVKIKKGREWEDEKSGDHQKKKGGEQRRRVWLIAVRQAEKRANGLVRGCSREHRWTKLCVCVCVCVSERERRRRGRAPAVEFKRVSSAQRKNDEKLKMNLLRNGPWVYKVSWVLPQPSPLRPSLRVLAPAFPLSNSFENGHLYYPNISRLST